MTALREGDVLLFRGTGSISHMIGYVSRTYSHMGMVVLVDGEMHFAHATPNYAKLPSKFSVVPFSGVMATRVVDAIDARLYRSIDVLRIPMNRSEIVACRNEFFRNYGAPFERDACALVCAACKCNPVATKDSFFCSELIARLLASAGRLPRSWDVHGLVPGDFLDLPGSTIVGSLRVPPPTWLRLTLVHPKPLTEQQVAAARRSVERSVI